MAKKILIVDDEPDIVLMLQIRLRANGYETVTAVNSQEGLEAVVKHHPDLILLDLRLPGIGGCEVAKQLKSNDLFKDIPIILLTASVERIADKIKECKVDDYSMKPFEPSDLLGKIKKFLP